MTEQINPSLNEHQLAAIQRAFHQGSADASQALAKWIGKPSVIEIDSLEQLPLEEATGILGTGSDPICSCAALMHGLLTGQLVLAFDDPSGLAIADLLLDQPTGTTTQWTEMATSAAIETANILVCAYLNSLSRTIATSEESAELMPSPPQFSRDYADSLLQFALMEQAISSDQIILASTRFEIDATAVNWTLLFVPDAQSISRLPSLLSAASDR